MVRLRDIGVAVLNLGGGVRRGDGLFQLKAKVRGEQRDLYAVRQIYRPDVYRRLPDDAGVSADETWFTASRVGCGRPLPAEGREPMILASAERPDGESGG